MNDEKKEITWKKLTQLYRNKLMKRQHWKFARKLEDIMIYHRTLKKIAEQEI